MRIALYILLVLCGFLVYLRLFERAVLFAPSRLIKRTPAEVRIAFEDVNFRSADGLLLNGWFLKTPVAAAVPATILYLHGNAGNISDRLEKMKYFLEMGLNVFIFDYRGYGKSAGYPTEKGLYLDARAAYDYLLARKDVGRDKIVIYGASLGGAAAIDLATEQAAPVLILEATFTSAADMAKRILPGVPSFLVSAKLDSIHKIQRLGMPKLFIHSPEDEVVPFALGLQLYEAAPQPKQFLEIRGGHNDSYEISSRQFFGGIKAFLRQYGILPD
jgi:uncharacterized protein